MKQYIGVIRVKTACVTLRACNTLRDIYHPLCQQDVGIHFLTYSLQRTAAKEVGYLADSACRIIRREGSDLRCEDRIHGAYRVMVLDGQIPYRKHTGGEIPSRGDGTLHGVGIEAHLCLIGLCVMREESFALRPEPEKLAHHGFKHTSS